MSNIWRSRVLKVNYSTLKLEKDFKESKDRELKDTETKITKEIEELFLKPINTSTNYMDKFVWKEMIKKRSLAKNTWYDWLLS